MTECIFCKMLEGSMECQKIYEDEEFLAFHDIFPKAKVHALVIPKKHIDSLNALQQEDEQLMGRLTLRLPQIAAMLGQENGYKVQIHTGEAGGQEVFHLHYHIMGNQ